MAGKKVDYLALIEKRAKGETDRVARVRVLLNPALADDENVTQEDIDAATIVAVCGATPTDKVPEVLETVGADSPGHHLWRHVLKENFKYAETTTGDRIDAIDSEAWGKVVDAMGWGELAEAHSHVDALLQPPDFQKS